MLNTIKNTCVSFDYEKQTHELKREESVSGRRGLSFQRNHAGGLPVEAELNVFAV